MCWNRLLRDNDEVIKLRGSDNNKTGISSHQNSESLPTGAGAAVVAFSSSTGGAATIETSETRCGFRKEANIKIHLHKDTICPRVCVLTHDR